MAKNTITMGKNNNIIISEYKEYLRDGRVRYVADVKHLIYAEHKIIKDYDECIVRQKKESLLAKWDKMSQEECNKDTAHTRTIEIKKLNNSLQNILIDGLTQEIDVFQIYLAQLENEVIYEKRELKRVKQEYRELVAPLQPKPAHAKILPTKPNEADYDIVDKWYFRIFPFIKRYIVNKKKEEYYDAIKQYDNECLTIKLYNEAEELRYNEEVAQYNNETNKFITTKSHLEQQSSALKEIISNKQKSSYKEIEKLKDGVRSGLSESVELYCAIKINSSSYPLQWERNVVASFNGEMLAIDMVLPSIDCVPNITSVRYSNNEFSPVLMSNKVFSNFYDDICYMITLRVINEIMSDENLLHISSLAINGWVTALNKATGHLMTNCILSVACSRKQIEEIDFLNVVPKLCFKALKGIASSELATMTAIQPIISLNKKDKRFVEHYQVADTLDETTNLASMHWEDFEHLIRELFEQEFSTNGGEVKVTRASRDGGVDAIAFDPDPIRGGKIVIQAKRYTNTVGVSAVRDLYGTVLNEGAIKGILVTTADYGSDSYDFAKDKPITLMNGSNLLYLLEKHGKHAKIDIGEAKKILNNQ
ncbi:MAG: restriction endonuclease [Alistipes sp.]|nr:restriction endonuclease [Alistipes sp.]